MQYELVIKNCTAVLPDTILTNCSIGVNEGKICKISVDEILEGNETIDATGLHVMSGLVDPHVHVGFAGNPPKEFYHESQNAAYGGVTTMLTYMLQKGSYLEKHEDNIRIGNENSMVDYALHYSIADQSQLSEIPKLANECGVFSYKYFMTCRGAESVRLKMEEVDDGLLYNYFRVLGATGAIPCVHCENMEIYFTLSKELKENGSDGLSAWDEARPSWAEAESIFRAVFLASKAKCPKIYIVHLSSEAGLEMIRTLRKMNLGIEIIVETCPHYLVLDVDCEAGILAKVNPPVRKKSDCEALWQAIQNDEIQTIGADHCVRTISNKGTSIWEGLPGFIGTGFLLQIILEYGYHQRNISLVALSKLMSENPAKIFGVYPQKGSISIGSDADFVLIDLNKKEKISATNCGSIGDYSVFEGFEVTGVPVRTILRGKTVMENRTIYRNRTNGRYIKAKL